MSSLTAVGRWINAPVDRLRTAVFWMQSALVFAAFALPLSSAPRLRDPLPLPGSVSVYASDVIVALALAFWPLAWAIAPRETIRRLRTPVIGIPFALFALCLVPGILRGHERYGASLVGQPLRIVLYAGIAAAMVSLTPRDAYRGLVAVLYAGAFWQAGLGAFSLASGRHQTSSYLLSTGGTRVIALSAAMFVSGALLLALINLDLDPVTRRRWLHLAVIPAAAFAIAVSYGRTTFAALVVVVPLLFLQLKRLRRSARRYWWAPALIVAAVAAVGPWIGATFVDRLTSNPLHDTTVRWRVAAVKASLAGIRSGDWKATSPLDPKRERVENGGFEHGTEGWYIQGGSISTIPSNNPFFGRHSLQLVTNGAQVDEGPYSAPALTAVGQSWTFSIWLKGQVGGELVNVSIWSYGDNESATGQANLPVTLSITPTQYVVSTTVTDRRTTHVRVLVRTRETAQAITVYGDDASLKSVRSSTGPRGGTQGQTVPVSGWVQQVLGGDGKPHEVGDATAVAAGRNYLTNPEFENGTEGWSVQGGTLKTIASNNPAFGRASLEMRTPGASTDEGFYSPLVPAHPGQTWVFSIWLKGFTEKERVDVAIWQYDRRGLSTTQSVAPFTLSTTPAQYFVVSTVSSLATINVRALVRTRGRPQAITLNADTAVLGLQAPPKPASSKPRTSGTGPASGSPSRTRGGLRSGEPLIGLGFGRSRDYIWNGNVYRLDGDPHNSFVWLLGGGGALALGTFLLLLIALVSDGWRRLRYSRGLEHALVLWALAMWLVLMINTLTGPILSDPPLLLAVWVVMLLPALVLRAEESPAERQD